MIEDHFENHPPATKPVYIDGSTIAILSRLVTSSHLNLPSYVLDILAARHRSRTDQQATCENRHKNCIDNGKVCQRDRIGHHTDGMKMIVELVIRVRGDRRHTGGMRMRVEIAIRVRGGRRHAGGMRVRVEIVIQVRGTNVTLAA